MPKLALVFIFGTLIGASVIFSLFHTLWIEHTYIQKFPDGGEYRGDINEGVPDGVGEIIWPNGASYTGELQSGLIQGQGTLVYSDGSSYTGSFVNGMSQGHGIYTNSEYTYVGQFEKDKFDGVGEQTLANGDQYRGLFQEDLYHGQGEYITSDDEQFSGMFNLGEFSGEGTYAYGKDVKYEGTFDNWQFQGKGKLTEADGSFYEGNFEGGEFNGNGKLTFANGDIFEGEFAHGQYHGAGQITYAEPLDGISKLSGTWRYGELVSCEGGCPLPLNSEIAERVLYNQIDLLNTQLENIQHGEIGTIELFFLGLAGYGHEAVFRREVLFSKDYFDRTMGTDNKSLALINDRITSDTYPLATSVSLQRSLSTLSEKMNLNEDILFVFLSSHGSQEHELSVEMPGLRLNDISAPDLAKALNESKIKWKVLVISACFSGGFIPHLEDEHTLIITAAAFNKTSFGCDDRNVFTYFGEALFKDSIPVSGSFSSAFEKARQIVAEKEKAQALTPSEPQISQPKAILDHLAKWRTNINKSLGN